MVSTGTKIAADAARLFNVIQRQCRGFWLKLVPGLSGWSAFRKLAGSTRAQTENKAELTCRSSPHGKLGQPARLKPHACLDCPSPSVKKSPVARSIWTFLGGFHPMAGHQPLAALKVYDGASEEEAKRKFQLVVKHPKSDDPNRLQGWLPCSKTTRSSGNIRFLNVN